MSSYRRLLLSFDSGFSHEKPFGCRIWSQSIVHLFPQRQLPGYHSILRQEMCLNGGNCLDCEMYEKIVMRYFDIQAKLERRS